MSYKIIESDEPEWNRELAESLNNLKGVVCEMEGEASRIEIFCDDVAAERRVDRVLSFNYLSDSFYEQAVKAMKASSLAVFSNDAHFGNLVDRKCTCCQQPILNPTGPTAQIEVTWDYLDHDTLDRIVIAIAHPECAAQAEATILKQRRNSRTDH
jgi:hypothetical protein